MRSAIGWWFVTVMRLRYVVAAAYCGGGNWYDRVGSKGVDMDGTEAVALGRADGAVCAEWRDGKRGEEAPSPWTMQIYVKEGADT